MMGPKKCEVCEETQSKYKCPACLITYCSLPCFKKHKEIHCQKVETLKVEKASSCNEIRDLVKDEKLQKLVHDIDSSADPESELDKAMEEESFRLFTEKIMSTIGP